MAGPRISPSTAVLINTNIMLGTGVFINTAKLAHATAIVSPLVYVCVGMLLYPLIRVFTRLQEMLPRGTLYDFGALLHPNLGFLSAWGYYVGKLASAYLGIHVFTHIASDILPWINPITTECILIAGFTWLYQQRVELTTSVQYTFMACKLMPLMFVTLVGLWWMTSAEMTVTLPETWQHFAASVPFVLFSFAGFEASCALSQSLPYPERDAPRVIIISYSLAVAVSALYQLSSWALLGDELAQAPTYLEAFTRLLQTAVPHAVVAWLNTLAISAIATSALGASYSIIFSNTWNLYTLASHGYVWFSEQVRDVNQYHMPHICSFVTGGMLLGYMIWSHGDSGPLQQLGAAGATWAYAISVISWVVSGTKDRYISYMAILSCGMFVYATIESGMTFGITAYCIFTVMILFGQIMYTSRQHYRTGVSQ